MTKVKLRNNSTYFVDKETGLVFNEVFTETSKYQIYKNNIDIENVKSLTIKEVEEYLIRQGKGFNQMILEMTSACNMRCKYCIYSDHYYYSKDYKNNKMSFEIAKKSVDFYFDNFKKVVYYNPFKKAFIGFYGGEPLLNFEVLKKTVEYVQSKYSNEYEVQYNITTNGLLLNEEVISFLVEYKFAITISIDGDAHNHDRNRIDFNGHNTHYRVMEAINMIRKNYPSYDLLGISACFDLKSDLMKMGEFFDKHKLFLTKLAPIDYHSTDYYTQFTQDDVDNMNNQLDMLKRMFKERMENRTLKKNSFLYAFMGIMYAELFIHPVMAEQRPWFIPTTSTCVPGEKIYVDTRGDIHMCEKINPYHIIGNINQITLNYENIVQIIKSYYLEVEKQGCQSCKTRRYCNLCFAQLATKEGFSLKSNQCSNQRVNALDLLKDSLELLEVDASLLEEVTMSYYRKILEKAGEITDEVF